MPDYFPELVPESRAKKLLDAARQHNTEFDAIDRAHGLATPADAGLLEVIRVVIQAAISGMEREDWPCVAEGVVMLQDAELQLRTQENRA